MVDNSAQNKDLERLMSMAAKFHGIDVPVMAIREESGTVIITVQGGAELRCKMDDLIFHHGDTEITEKKKELRRFESDKKKSQVKK